MTRDEAAGLILARILVREGGIAELPGEGFVTRYGQTPAWLRTFGLTPPETTADALANYHTWLVRTRLIAVCDYPDTLADALIDWSVNAGHGFPVAELQRALGGLRIDAILGPETAAAIDRCDRRRTAAALVAAKFRYHADLIGGNPARNARYARSWIARDCDHIATLEEEGR